MKKNRILLILVSLCLANLAFAGEMKVEGRKLVSEKPRFTMALPSEFQFIDSSSVENREENSRTRTFLFIKAKNKQVEDLLIVQIADKTNPQAGPMTVPALRPLAEKKLFSKGKVDRKGLEIDYLIQIMAWNPNAVSLRPLAGKGITVPSRWALQGQCLVALNDDHAVFIRYSKDANSFGFGVSEESKNWDKDTISANERKVCELFQKTFMMMIDSLRISSP